MKNRLKGLLALMLSLTMLLSMVVTVSAATYADYQITTTDKATIAATFNGVADVTEDSGTITIKLTSDINGRLDFDNNNGTFILDMNGKTIDPGTKNEALCLNNNFGGTVTVVGSGTFKTGVNNIIYGGTKLTFDVSSADYEYFTLKKDGADVFEEKNNEAKTLNTTYFKGSVLVLTQMLAEDYPIYIGDTQLTSANISNYAGVSYTPADGSDPATLTLDGFTGTSISADGDLNIVLKGDNTVADTTSATSGGAAVVVRGDLTITSENNGSLNATSANNYGIYAANTLSFDKANVSVGCTIGLVANKIYINESTVTIDADSTAISCSELAFGSGWQYQWTSDAAVPMRNVAFDLATYNANPTAYLKFASYTTTNTPTPPSGGYYPIYIPTVEEKPEDTTVDSATTFDSGIALHIAVTVLSATGGAWLAKKKD